VGNEPERRQTRCLGPRCVFFFFLHVFLTYLPYFAHLSAPIYMFQPLAMLSSPNYMFQPPAMRSNLPAACFDLFQHPRAQMTCLALFRPSVCFLFLFFLLICSIIHICQPPATCFDPQPCFPPRTTHFNPQPHILTIGPCLSTSSHTF
jgi:hypothetical protein